MRIIVNIIGIAALLVLTTIIYGQRKFNSPPVIDIAGNVKSLKKINLTEYTDDIRYIRLEFREGNPIGNIKYTAITDKYILITDNSACYLYDIKGNFIRKIGSRGNGPGEYQTLISSQINNDKIYIQSVFDLFEYKIDGSFVRKVRNRFSFNNNTYQYTRNWIFINDSLVFSHMPNPTGNIPFKALLTNNEGKIVKSYNNYLLFYPERPITLSNDNAHIYKFNGKIFFKENYSDTIFYLDNQLDLVPDYVFSLGKYKEPTSVRERPLAEVSTYQNKYISIPNIFQTDSYLFIKCRFGDNFPAKRLNPIIVNLPGGNTSQWYSTTNILGVYNKQTRTIYLSEPTSTDNSLFTSGFYNDFDAGPRFMPDIQVNDMTLAMWVNVVDLKNHVASNDFKNANVKYPEKKLALRAFSDGLSESDNQILMLVTIKNK